ncbi:MAG: SUMF1/EgtB/PvdO family nonheme iron enzyme, partial [Candidatus Tectomicrobia bacterium]|nr:SUMF1/EgtB/PvdO family nonheme iron enzyme [Candidatus Tectomicrobia bacterium]
MNSFARRLVGIGLLAAWAAGLAPGPARGAAPAGKGSRAGMVLVPAGPFLMGRNGGPPEEAPAHEVHLPAFYIDRNLVTWAEYARFIQAKGPAG